MSNLRMISREILHNFSHLPSVLSISRIVLTPVIWVLLNVHSSLAFPLYLITCLTDFFDGKLARFLNSTSKNGAILDASADFFLLSVGFYYYISIGLAPPSILVFMTLSFLQYIITSRIPIDDHLGKHVGTILYFLLAAMMLSPKTQSSTITNFIALFYISTSLIIRFYRIIIYICSKERTQKVE